MSLTFTKLFSSITESTIWMEPHATRLVWITMLAMTDRNGLVFGSVPGLAHRARVSVEECRAALRTLLEPDPESRTPDHGGRRIEVIDGGWRLLNHAKYRAIQSDEAVRSSKREHMRRKREEWKSTSTVDIGRQSPSASGSASESASGVPDPEAGKVRKPRKRSELTECPPDFAPNAAHRTAADKHRVNLTDAFEHFLAHHAAKGTKFKNWDQALHGWIIRQKSFGARGGGNRNSTRDDAMAYLVNIANGKENYEP